MQSMFRLPWSTESPGDKIMEKAALHKSRPMPAVEMPAFMNKMKRKHTGSPEPASPQHAHVVKKWKDANGEVKPAVIANGSLDRAVVDGVADSPKPAESEGNAPRAASAHVIEARPKAQPHRKEGASKSKVSKESTPAVKSESSADTSTSAMESNMTALQQAIEAQINYEILLKHNELRIIEQELAKCQVSLEQLRRCALIPFPGTEGLSLDVSDGVGASLQPPSGYTTPQYAAPWGVTDGPYTRHYSRWLISDAKFDPVSERALAQQAHGYFGVGEGRTTRGSFAEFGSNSKARTSRTSTGTLKLQALGENPAPAPKPDPLLHKRSTDGQWVRLYCAQCGHSNFSNTQGFLNHCRIKHNQVFKSHDQAAIACGVPVDNEGSNSVPATEPTAALATTPTITFPSSTTSGFVHPLIRANPPVLAKDVHREFGKLPEPARKAPTPPPSFSASPSTPHLTALLQKRGFEGNLKGLVDTARTKVDLAALETPDDAKPTQLARLPVTATAASDSKAPTGSQKGQGNGHPRLPLSLPTSALHGSDGHLPDFAVELSPNTVESNPGLVSDHDDDDDEDHDDAHSQMDILMHDDDVVVEDASDIEGVQERTGSRQGLQGCFEKGEASRKH
jgi:ADA HAT complex component 1